MTTRPRSSTPLGLAGVVILAAGVLVWVWTGDWRWAATGGALLLALAGVGAAIDRRRS